MFYVSMVRFDTSIRKYTSKIVQHKDAHTVKEIARSYKKDGWAMINMYKI